MTAIEHFDILTAKKGFGEGTTGNYQIAPKLLTLQQIPLKAKL